MLKVIKAAAILFAIVVAVIAVAVFGVFIGTLLLVLGTGFVMGVFLYIGWLTIMEHQESKRP